MTQTAKAPTSTRGRLTLERNKDLGCPICLAPGIYKCDTITRDGYTPEMISEMIRKHPELSLKAYRFAQGWPGCYVQMNDPRLNQPVGEVCPNCGAKRSARKKLNKMLIQGRLF